MSIFSTLATELNNKGIAAQSASEKPKLIRNPMKTAKEKLVRRLNDSIEFAKANDNDAKKSCYTIKGNEAVIGVKYGNAYLEDDSGEKFITVAVDTKQIVTVLKALINAVEKGLFDAKLGEAVAREQERSKERYAKRKASSKTTASKSKPSKNNALSLVPAEDEVEAFANR